MNPTLATFVGGFGMGTGITAVAFAWWVYRPRRSHSVPGLYPVAGPPDPATVSDDSDLQDGADCWRTCRREYD